MFDLTSLVPKDSTPKKTYTEEEKKSLLEGYEPIPQELWSKIPAKTHIRYESSTAGFKRGAFVSHHWTSAKDGKRYIQLIFDQFKRADRGNNPSWSIGLDTTLAIWKKKSFDNQVARANYGEQGFSSPPQHQPPPAAQIQLAKDIRVMANEFKLLRARVAKLEANERGLIRVVEKLSRAKKKGNA